MLNLFSVRNIHDLSTSQHYHHFSIHILSSMVELQINRATSLVNDIISIFTLINTFVLVHGVTFR